MVCIVCCYCYHCSLLLMLSVVFVILFFVILIHILHCSHCALLLFLIVLVSTIFLFVCIGSCCCYKLTYNCEFVLWSIVHYAQSIANHYCCSFCIVIEVIPCCNYCKGRGSQQLYYHYCSGTESHVTTQGSHQGSNWRRYCIQTWSSSVPLPTWTIFLFEFVVHYCCHVLSLVIVHFNNCSLLTCYTYFVLVLYLMSLFIIQFSHWKLSCEKKQWNDNFIGFARTCWQPKLAIIHWSLSKNKA